MVIEQREDEQSVRQDQDKEVNDLRVEKRAVEICAHSGNDTQQQRQNCKQIRLRAGKQGADKRDGKQKYVADHQNEATDLRT